jgi:hypothetical protein
MATIVEVAEGIRGSLRGKFNDLEYLAQLIEDSSIVSTAPGNELQNRMVTIFDASSDWSGGGVTHFEGILEGCTDRGFRVDFRDGSNQVGHFLTAVDMGFRPVKTSNYLRELGLNPTRGHLGKGGYTMPPPSRLDRLVPFEERLCVSLIIRHEQVSDAPDWIKTYVQFVPNTYSAITEPNEDEVIAFFRALDLVPLGAANLAITRAALAPIKIGTGYGNSLQDLHLSLYGYQLGRFIRSGLIASRNRAATWIRWNIGGSSASTQ